MLFVELRSSLIAVLRARVRNGELTERGLARLVGVSQPHIHNVLKGARALSPELSDQILQHLRISLLDLIERERIEAHLNFGLSAGEYVYVPLLRGRIGPGFPWPTETAENDRLPFGAMQVGSIPHPVASRLAEDARMSDAFSDGDIALLDQSARARTEIEPSAYYVVKSGNGGIIRRIQVSGGMLYLIPEDCAHRSSGWQRIPLEGRQVTQFLRARAHLVTPIYEWAPR
jgi:transcriptional regulator with XRE-family HTH domain